MTLCLNPGQLFALVMDHCISTVVLALVNARVSNKNTMTSLRVKTIVTWYSLTFVILFIFFESASLRVGRCTEPEFEKVCSEKRPWVQAN